MLSPNISDFFEQIFILTAMFSIFYYFILRPRRIAGRKRWAALKSIQSGQMVVLTSGMIGIFLRKHGDYINGTYEIIIGENTHVFVIEQGIKLVFPKNYSDELEKIGFKMGRP